MLLEMDKLSPMIQTWKWLPEQLLIGTTFSGFRLMSNGKLAVITQTLYSF